jgi:hypothetical protein
MNEIATSLLKAETIFSFVFVITVLGFGGWFAKSGWPWLTKFLERRQELQFKLDEKRIDTEAESDRRWQETTAKMTTIFADLKEELGATRAVQTTWANVMEKFYQHVVKNGNNLGSGG